MPWTRNRFFVGREPDLRQLARTIKQGGKAAVGQSPAVTGMGGQGKTQLAVEFAYRYGRWFKGGVFWVNFSDLATIPEAVAACGPALYADDPGFSARPLPDRVALRPRRGRVICRGYPVRQLRGRGPSGRLGAQERRLPAADHRRRAVRAPQRGITTLPLGGLTRPRAWTCCTAIARTSPPMIPAWP